MLRINRIARARHRFWSISVGIGLAVVAVVCALFYSSSRPPPQVSSVGTSDPSVAVPSSWTTITPVVLVETPPPQLPHLDFAPGSVEEACGLNEFVPYHFDDPDNEYHWPRSPYDANGNLADFFSESEECRMALDSHINSINPYLWGNTNKASPQAFVVLNNPLTFERIFADPAGDLARVQDALSRPECLLQGDETNWELKETCHADAFLNYALINRFCFDEGISNRNRTYYWEEDNPTPEQDRFMWKEYLEGVWVERKCAGLDSELELTSEHYPVLYESVMSFRETNDIKGWNSRKGSRVLLIELAARLGDDAAGLTTEIFVPHSHYYLEDGGKYGRFTWLLTSAEWQGFVVKKEPSTDRFLQIFKMLGRVGARRPDPRDEIELAWDFVVRHLCEPPYFTSFGQGFVQVENGEHSSCKEIVHELRQRDLKFAPLLQALDKFEQVALELEVYE